jgi:hypothetical protein
MMTRAREMAIAKYNTISRANISLLFFFNLSISVFYYRMANVSVHKTFKGYEIVTIGVAFVYISTSALTQRTVCTMCARYPYFFIGVLKRSSQTLPTLRLMVIVNCHWAVSG